jgi:amino acid transporter
MTQQAPPEGLGAGRKLRLVDAVAQSVGFMGPVFSIAFLVPQVVGITSATGNGAGIAAPLAVLIAAIGVLGFGWIVAQYARRVHAAGALYDYVTIGLGQRAGGASGLMYYAGVLVLGAALLIMLGGTIHDTLLAEFHHALLPELGWDIVLLAIVGLTVFFGVALSTRTQLVLAAISITVVTVFFIYVVVKVGSANDPASTFDPSRSPHGATGVLFGVLYGVLLFTGFETAANLGEETRQPGRDIPRAVLFSVLAVTGFYLLGSYAQVAGFHFNLDAIGKAAGAPLFALASPAAAGGFGSVTLVRLMELVVVLDMLAVLLGCATAGSRGLFAMARDGRLPAPLAVVSRRGTPLTAGLVVMAGYVVAVLVSTQWGSLWGVPGEPHYAAMFSVLATFGSFSLACVYFLLSLGAFRGLAGHRRRYAVVLAAVVGMLVTGAAIFGAVYKVTGPVAWVPVPAAAVFLIGLATRRKALAGQSSPSLEQVAGTGASEA